MSLQQTCLFELCQHTVDSGQSDIHVFADQVAIDVFRSHVPSLAGFVLAEQVENFQARKSRLQAAAFQVFWIIHNERPG